MGETLELLQQFSLEKELTEGDILPLLLNVRMPSLTDRKTGKKGVERTGKRPVTSTALAALKTVGIPAVRIHACGQYYARIGYWRSASGARQRAELQRMLNWAHHQSTISYRHSEGVDELFKKRFRNPNPVRIARYDPDILKKLLASASDRQQLYIYLALNCGYYPSDIGTLQSDEVVVQDQETFLVRKRSKTSHQNDFEAKHVLWPETAALLKREMAKSAQFPRKYGNLVLLTFRGTPLYRRSPKCDNIGEAYLTLHRTAGVDLPFKQFRKIGATAMQRLGGDEIRRLYKGGTIDDGDKVYVLETWDKLTPHLLAWGHELRLDGVLYDR
jgi:hypothetical protein